MAECGQWVAWLDVQPRGTPVLHVTGVCTLATTGFATFLIRHQPTIEMPQPAPAIRAAALAPRLGSPPEFVVNAGPDRFFAVEVGSTPGQLEFRGELDGDRGFYASWQEEGLLSGDRYRLPAAAWEMLRQSDELYYRILTSRARTAWVEMTASLPRTLAMHAPFIRLVDALPEPAANERWLERRVEPVVPRDVAILHQPTRVDVHYKETTDERIESVRLLPDLITVPIELVP